MDARASTAPSQPATAAREADTRPLVVCFGDSLTAGYGADPGQSYPDYLQKDLDAQGYRYRVVNEGVSGATTKDGIDRVAGIAAMHAAVVVVEFGGNDGLRGLKTEITRANLAQIIQTLQASGTKVVLAGISLPPDFGADYVNAFTANYPALAKQFKTPLLPFLLKDVYGVPGMMQADRTHATNKGNEIVAKNVLQMLSPQLEKSRE
ncbi:arylesterase [Granulicella rosea]|nr:arylesterase [Granulicella rosea]